MDRRGSSS